MGLKAAVTTVAGNTNILFDSDDFRFALDNFNTTSYLTRRFDQADWLTSPYSRMTGNALPTAGYRTFWATDVNYDADLKDNGNYADADLARTTSNIYPVSPDDPTTAKADYWRTIGNETPLYCMENTFDVAHMQDNATTSILVRLALNEWDDEHHTFYTTSVTGRDIIYQEPANDLTEEGTSASSSFSRRAAAPRRANKPTDVTIDTYLRQWLWQTSQAFRSWVNTYAAGDARHVAISVTPAGTWGTTGQATVSATQTACATGTAGATAFNDLYLGDYFAQNITVYRYQYGYCYYRVPIRHFTDSETPWRSLPDMTDNTPATVYGADAASSAAFLGRYGVVRNNWYDITINSVTHIGAPIIPVLTANADDRIEQLLNATLTVSSWTTVTVPTP